MWSVLIPVEREIFALAKENVLDAIDPLRCWFLLWIGPLSKDAELPLTRRCGSLIRLYARREFHPTPDSLFRPLAPEVLLARRCGREDEVSFRRVFHPMTELCF